MSCPCCGTQDISAIYDALNWVWVHDDGTECVRDGIGFEG